MKDIAGLYSSFIPCETAAESQADILHYIPAAEKQVSSTDVAGCMIPNYILKHIYLYQKLRSLVPPDITPLRSSQCGNQK